jgi:Putative bacterial sensory transduction regulator
MPRVYALIMMVLVPLAAHAGALPDGGVTAPEIADVLKNAGYPADIVAGRTGDPLVRSSTGKTLFDAHFFQCGPELRCASIQFTAPYRRKGMTSATIANWNRELRFGRVFQDRTGVTRIAMDVETSHGITTEALDANIRRWITVLNAFEIFVAG